MRVTSFSMRCAYPNTAWLKYVDNIERQNSTWVAKIVKRRVWRSQSNMPPLRRTRFCVLKTIIAPLHFQTIKRNRAIQALSCLKTRWGRTVYQACTGTQCILVLSYGAREWTNRASCCQNIEPLANMKLKYFVAQSPSDCESWGA